MKAADLPRLDDIPIPADVQPGKGWTAQMLEMADHIGAYATLLISDHFGGEEVYIAANPDKNVFRDLIGPAKAEILSRVYRREKMAVPTAKFALRHARRAGVLSAVRADQLTVADAARIMQTRRDYASKLVNQTNEGLGADPLPLRIPRRDPRQIEMFVPGDDD